MRIKFSKIELRDLFKAWVIISLAFGIVITGGIFGLSLLTNFVLAGVTVGMGFIFHELGHKFVAQRYGCFAEFRANNFMLFLAVITAFFGVIFAAPGAVMIFGHVGKERNGKIALAGPLVNLIIALIFLGLSFFVINDFLVKIVAFGFLVNVWLALFNMIPIWILDGKKIWDWNKIVYFFVLLIVLVLFFGRDYIPGFAGFGF